LRITLKELTGENIDMKKSRKLIAAVLLLAVTALALPAFTKAERVAAADISSVLKYYLNGNGTNAGTFPDGTSRYVGAADVNKGFSGYTFVDIRTDALYNAGHIAGSYHIVYGEALGKNFKFVPLDKPIIIVSNDGQLGWQVTGALNTIFAADGIDTKVISWQGGYTTDGIDAEKISKDATALPSSQNALSDAANKLIADYVGGLKNAKYDNFIVSEEETWKVVNGINKKKKDFTSKFTVVFLPAFKGTYVGDFNDSIFRSDYGGKDGSVTLSGLDKSKTILVACGSGQTSDNVVGALRVAGYDAYSVNKGWGGNKGDVSGDKKNGGVQAYDASQVAAGNRALFAENDDGSIRNKKNWIPVVISVGGVVIEGVAVFIVLKSRKKKAEQ
jgi:rhodanese-related sulfurtransferase